MGGRRRQIDYHDIADVSVRKNRFSAPRSFSLACRLASGNVLISPPLPDITRVNETGASVAQLLGLPEAPFVDNRLDAGNAEIILGPPVSPGFGRVIRMALPVAAGLCGLPFLIAFWLGKSELALGLLLPLGVIVTLALYRYAHRLTGAFWIVGHGEIRIERIALNGQPTADTIQPSDVVAIEVVKPSSADRNFSINLELRTGKTLRSSTRHDENGAHAVRAEIIRRLKLPPDVRTPAG